MNLLRSCFFVTDVDTANLIIFTFIPNDGEAVLGKLIRKCVHGLSVRTLLDCLVRIEKISLFVFRI